MNGEIMSPDINQHANHLLEMMHYLYQHRLLTDFVFVIMPSKEEIPVHKPVITAFCRHFWQQLQSGNLNDSHYVLEDVHAVTLSLLLDFMYTGQMALTTNNVEDVMSLAAQFDAQTAVEYCQMFLTSQINKEVKDECLQPTTDKKNKSKAKRSYVRSIARRTTKNEDLQIRAAENMENCEISESSYEKNRQITRIKSSKQIKVQIDKSCGRKVNTEPDALVSGQKMTQEGINARNGMIQSRPSVKEYKYKQTLLMSKLYHCRICKKAFIYSSLRGLHERIHGFVPYSVRITDLLVYRTFGSFHKRLQSGVSQLNSLHCGQHNKEAATTAAREQSVINTLHGYSTISSAVGECSDNPGVNVQTDMLLLTAKSNRCTSVERHLGTCTNSLFRSWPYKKKVILYEVKGRHYFCHQCEACFPMYVLLKMHLLQHHRKWKCRCCRCYFQSAKSLALHQRIETEKKCNLQMLTSQRCHLCNRVFLHLNNLRHHKESVEHSSRSVRLLCCGNCQLTFRNISNFCRHPCYVHMYPLLNNRYTNYCRERAVTKQIIQKAKQDLNDVTVQESANQYKCKLCSTTFALYYHGRMHVRIHHQGSALYKRLWRELVKKERIQCDESGCSFTSTNVMKLAVHVEEQHPGVGHKCNKCPFTTSVLHKLALHLCREHGLGKLCEICGKSFKKRLQLRIHRVSKHNLLDPVLKPISCNVNGCHYVTYHKSLIKQHMIKHSIDNLYPCPYCGRKLKREKYLTKHINKVHMDIRPFICDQCGAKYGEKSELKSHMARHESVARYHCEHCSYTTQDKGNLKSHMWSRHKLLLNKNQKLFSCDMCDYRCDRRTRFMDHLNTHKQVRQFHCKICGHTFFTKSTLEGHLKVVHSDSTVQCTYCEYKTKNKYHLKNHIRVMHTHRNVKPYKCPYCEFRCASSGNCRKHVMNRHKGLPVTWVKVNDGEVMKGVVTPGMQQKLAASQQTSSHQSTSIGVKELFCDGASTKPVLVSNNIQQDGTTVMQQSVQQLDASMSVSQAVNAPGQQYGCVLETEQTKMDAGVVTQSVQLEEPSTKSLSLYVYLSS